MSWNGLFFDDMQNSHQCHAGNTTCMKGSMQDDMKAHRNAMQETVPA
jgi:hypothetical protein